MHFSTDIYIYFETSSDKMKNYYKKIYEIHIMMK